MTFQMNAGIKENKRKAGKSKVECWNWVQQWSHVRGILSACEKAPKNTSPVTSVSSKTWNCSWNVFLCSSQVQWIGMRLLQLLLVICFATCSLSLWLYTAGQRENLTQVTLLNPKSINLPEALNSWPVRETVVPSLTGFILLGPALGKQ